jgi:hypothetical protein
MGSDDSSYYPGRVGEDLYDRIFKYRITGVGNLFHTRFELVGKQACSVSRRDMIDALHTLLSICWGQRMKHAHADMSRLANMA